MTSPVSVIIPTFNRKDMLQKAVHSVVQQRGVDFELLVVDDGSTDGTEEVIQKQFPGVVYVYQENKGAAAARNTGIRHARHDLLAFLDSDDCFAPRKLAIQGAAMQANPHYLVSHTQEIWYRRGKILNQKNKHRKEQGDLFARSLKLCVVGMSTIMARRSLFEEVGMFDEQLPCCEDYDLWLRVGAKYPFLLVDEPLTIKDGGRSDQLSVQHRVGMDRYRIRSIQNLLASGMLDQEQDTLARAELVRKCRIYGQGCMKHGRTDEGQKCFALARQYDIHDK